MMLTKSSIFVIIFWLLVLLFVITNVVISGKTNKVSDIEKKIRLIFIQLLISGTLISIDVIRSFGFFYKNLGIFVILIFSMVAIKTTYFNEIKKIKAKIGLKNNKSVDNG